MPVFTAIPHPYATLSEPVRYAVRQDDDTPGDLLIRIASTDGTLLGVKRFVAVTAAEFDIAPIVRRAVRFAPSSGGTGFCPADDRMAAIVVSARTLTDTSTDTPTDAPVRRLLPCRRALTGPTLLTTMPAVRMIAPGQSDELTLWSDAPLTVTVIARQGDTVAAQSYRTADAGLHLFRLDMRDFPEAETLTVDAGPCGMVRYHTIRPPEGSVRLAWRTAAGSIEHYTFPVVRTATVEGRKQRILSPEGRTAIGGRTERRLGLESAFERPEVLEALAELTASVQVWYVQGDRSTPVDAVTEQSVIDRRGALGTLNVEIRSTRNDDAPWS